MKKKNIILVLFLIMMFMFIPNRVKAEQICEYNVDNIKGTSANLVWKCPDGGLNSATIYQTDSTCTDNENVIKEVDGTGWGMFIAEGKYISYKLSPKTYYLASFKAEKGDVVNICFKTNSYADNYILKENNSQNVCDLSVDDITDKSVKISWSNCSESMDSVSIYKSDENCKIDERIYYNGPLAFSYNSYFKYSALSSDSYYYVGYKINGDIKPGFCFKTASKMNNDAEVFVDKTQVSDGSDSGINTNLSSEDVENDNGNQEWTYEQMGTATTMSAEDVRTSICDEGLKTELRKYWSWFTIIGPIALIILVSLDFVKAIISGNADTLKKSSTNAVKRTAAVIILLMTPWLLRIIFGIVGLEEYICF